ncbi:MAG: DNA polymerase I [Phycisphaerae bacterium]|nr:DNA polymerase I [Phycisphaerae bacterium]
MARRFFIIDGLGQIFRSYYAPFQHLSSPRGEPTRATFVFTQMLLQLIREQKPDYLAMAMDSPDAAVFRRGIDPQYKANREPPPEDLAPQIQRILQIVASQAIPIISIPTFEADDVMATLCRRLADQHDLQICLVSKDKDLDQLLSDRVCLFDPGKNEFLGPEDLRRAKGYGPDKAVEIQTLTGDSTDNVPGVKGVGPKKAADLIARFGSAAVVIEHAAELTPAMRQNVQAFAEHLERTRQLVTLRQDVPFEFNLEACRWTGLNAAALHPVFVELGFRRLADQFADLVGSASDAGAKSTPPPSTPQAANRPTQSGQGQPFGPQHDLFSGLSPVHAAHELPPSGPAPAAPGPGQLFAARPEREYLLIDTPESLTTFLAELRKQPRFAFDTETTHINPAWAKLVGLSFSWKRDTGYYLPVRGVGRTLPLKSTLEALRPIMADPKVGKIGQNIKYDLVVMSRHGVPVNGVEFDTMVASFVLDSSRRSHGMDALARELLGFEPIPISDLIGKGKDQITFDQVPTDRACEYSAEDADVTWSLYKVFSTQMAGSDVDSLFHDTEMPLVEVLAAMEAEGVKLDTPFLRRMSGELAGRLDDLTRQIHEAAGHPFNIDSTRQLAAVLFDELKLPSIKKTKTGQSTDAETLETLAWQTDHPVPKLVKEYRELVKLKGTYIDTLPEMVCPDTGRVHASFNQTVAVTGRLSSSDPNLQNIPIRTEIGRQIRRAFVPSSKTYVLLTADYSQIELRVMAHFCQDAALMQAFVEDRDIHQFVAAQVFGVPIDQVTREQRGRAKAVNFGIIYGQTAFGLSRTTGMAVGEAQTFIDKYFARYPGLRQFIDQAVAEARRAGHVRTILGRRRAIENINSRNTGLRSAAERFAINTIIQGSAADLIKQAMINIHRKIREGNRPTRMLIQVHDELVFDAPRSAVETEAEFIRQEMCNALPLRVPVKVDLAWGDNWFEGK